MNIKNRQTLYAVLRHDFSGKDCIIAIAADAERADNLAGEYEQLFQDKGIGKEEAYFYVTGATFYD